MHVYSTFILESMWDRTSAIYSKNYPKTPISCVRAAASGRTKPIKPQCACAQSVSVNACVCIRLDWIVCMDDVSELGIGKRNTDALPKMQTTPPNTRRVRIILPAFWHVTSCICSSWPHVHTKTHSQSMLTKVEDLVMKKGDVKPADLSAAELKLAVRYLGLEPVPNSKGKILKSERFTAWYDHWLAHEARQTWWIVHVVFLITWRSGSGYCIIWTKLTMMMVRSSGHDSTVSYLYRKPWIQLLKYLNFWLLCCTQIWIPHIQTCRWFMHPNYCTN